MLLGPGVSSEGNQEKGRGIERKPTDSLRSHYVTHGVIDDSRWSEILDLRSSRVADDTSGRVNRGRESETEKLAGLQRGEESLPERYPGSRRPSRGESTDARATAITRASSPTLSDATGVVLVLGFCAIATGAFFRAHQPDTCSGAAGDSARSGGNQARMVGDTARTSPPERGAASRRSHANYAHRLWLDTPLYPSLKPSPRNSRREREVGKEERAQRDGGGGRSTAVGSCP